MIRPVGVDSKNCIVLLKMDMSMELCMYSADLRIILTKMTSPINMKTS